MLNLFKRDPKVLVEGSSFGGRVYLDDLDFNMHMSNSCYFKKCDYARIDLFMESGFYQFLKQNQLWWAVGGMWFSFKREIKPFSAWTLTSKLHSYDNKWIFVEHKFSVKGQVHAIGFSKIVVKRKDRRTVEPKEVLSLFSKTKGGSVLLPLIENPPNVTGIQFGSDIANVERSLDA